MATPQEYARAFRRLHRPGDPLVLFNVWDAGTAKAAAEAGARAIATASWSVAAAHGYADGEKLPFELALANLRRVVNAVDLPVSVDLEGGYGVEPEAVARSVRQAIGAGAIGLNLEDGVIGGEGLHPLEAQVARLRAARMAADGVTPGAFLNARTDVFLVSDESISAQAKVAEALRRADAFAGAGADGLFVPGVSEDGVIAQICEASPLPVNVFIKVDPARLAALASLGVARISHGPNPYRLALEAFRRAAQETFEAS